MMPTILLSTGAIPRARLHPGNTDLPDEEALSAGLGKPISSMAGKASDTSLILSGFQGNICGELRVDDGGVDR